MRKSLLQTLREAVTGEKQDTSGFVNPDTFEALDQEGIPIPKEDLSMGPERDSGLRDDGTLDLDAPVEELQPHDVTKDLQKHINW